VDANGLQTGRQGVYTREKETDTAMLVYHASLETVERPIVFNRYRTLDFGTGFYTTPNENQAREFAVKAYNRRGHKGLPTVNIYEYDDKRAAIECSIQIFAAPNLEWLDFVAYNRRNGRATESHDIIVGPVANDDVFEVITLYESGQIDQNTAIERFRVKELFNQILFCNERTLEFLTFTYSYVLGASQ
jgi:hypothetical protein